MNYPRRQDRREVYEADSKGFEMHIEIRETKLGLRLERSIPDEKIDKANGKGFETFRQCEKSLKLELESQRLILNERSTRQTARALRCSVNMRRLWDESNFELRSGPIVSEEVATRPKIAASRYSFHVGRLRD